MIVKIYSPCQSKAPVNMKNINNKNFGYFDFNLYNKKIKKLNLLEIIYF